jgi:hypothetical protein
MDPKGGIKKPKVTAIVDAIIKSLLIISNSEIFEGLLLGGLRLEGRGNRDRGGGNCGEEGSRGCTVLSIE